MLEAFQEDYPHKIYQNTVVNKKTRLIFADPFRKECGLEKGSSLNIILGLNEAEILLKKALKILSK